VAIIIPLHLPNIPDACSYLYVYSIVFVIKMVNKKIVKILFMLEGKDLTTGSS